MEITLLLIHYEHSLDGILTGVTARNREQWGNRDKVYRC